MYGEEIQRLIEEAMAHHRRVRSDERLFVIVDYLANGRMTRSLARANTEKLAEIYGVPAAL